MSGTEAAPTRNPSRASRLLGLVRQLIDCGRQLAATLRSPHQLGASDIAVILARITRGLLRAEALEARITRSAHRLDAAPAPPRALSCQRSPHTRAAVTQPSETRGSRLDCLPTPEQIAAEVRRRPIGAVLADICRDLGIMPNHPLWRELSSAIIRYGGNLANLMMDILERAHRSRATARSLNQAREPVPQSAIPSSTGPPRS